MRVELAEVSSKERTKDAGQAGLAEPIFYATLKPSFSRKIDCAVLESNLSRQSFEMERFSKSQVPQVSDPESLRVMGGESEDQKGSKPLKKRIQVKERS